MCIRRRQYGARITEVFLNAGHDVTMIDIKPEFTERGKTVIAHDYDFLVKKGKMTEEHKDELLAALKTTVDRNAAADADFVMEVILERMDLKKDLLEDLDKICPEHTIFASNDLRPVRNRNGCMHSAPFGQVHRLPLLQPGSDHERLG